MLFRSVGLMNTADDLCNLIDKVLKGIDEDRCYTKDGWWEHSGQVEWGAAKLAELKEAVRAYLDAPEMKDDNDRIPYEVLLNYCAEINRAYANLVDKFHGDEVKDEPVYLARRKGLDDFFTCSKYRYEELSVLDLFETKLAYLHPPTKTAPMKPMTDAEILKEWQCHFYDDGWIGFEAGIRFAERHHGIGGGGE